MAKFQPCIKWSGSKRSQSSSIIKYFPKNIDTYYEPCVGGGSILRELLESDIVVNKCICSDINADLMNLWNEIKNNPKELIQHYRKLWEEMNVDEDTARKREYYTNLRKEFNETHNPKDFLFLTRTAYNGMIRYNGKGEFNSPFHLNRNGIHPDKLEEIILEWSELINKGNVEFICCDYKDITPNENDFMYLDPPYANTKGMYYGALENTELFDYLSNLKCKWLLSYDGVSGAKSKIYDVPKEIYDDHILLKSGNSSFKRIKEIDRNAMVYESLYLKK